MTNLELIQSLGVDAMACILAQICYERDEIMLKRLAELGIEASLIGIAPKLQVQIHKDWLLEEADIQESNDGT